MTAGMKIGTHVRADAAAEELDFLAQLGIEHVRVHVPQEMAHAAALAELRQRFAEAGLTICSVVNLLYQAREIAFGLPERTEVFGRLADFIEAMGQEGIPMLEYDFFLYAPLPQTGTTTSRGATTREFDLDVATTLPPVTGEQVTAAQMWARHAALLDAILPAAERANVRLALHPDDPPVPTLLGMPRIFGTLDSLDRLFEQFPSPWLGILFCVGTWAEGGDDMGADICSAIRHFASRGRLFSVHFRNVSNPLPRFHETFLDNGCVDMHAVMQTLHEVGFTGLAIPDHCPTLRGDSLGRAALAQAIGFMQALNG